MLIASLALILHAPPDGIDVREPAAVGSVMAARVAALYGEKVVADETIADLPLFAYGKALTFEAFREASAEGWDAAWRERDGAWEVYRTPEQIADEEAAFLSRRSAWVRAQIKERQRPPLLPEQDLDELALNLKLATDDELEELAYAKEVVSGEAVMYDVWQALGAEYIANHTVDRRSVFTSDGRKGTKRLAALSDVIAVVREQTARVRKALEASGALARIESSPTMSVEELLNWMGVGEVECFVLEVSVTQFDVTLILTGFDKRGVSTVSFSDSLYGNESETSEVLATVVDVKVPYSTESREVHKTLHGAYWEDEGRFDPLLDVLAALPEQDPASYEISDALFAYAKGLDRPLFGRLDNVLSSNFGVLSLETGEGDGDTIGSNSEPPPDFSLKAALDSLDASVQFLAGEKCVRIRPELPPRWQVAFPRRAMGEYVRANRGRKLLDLSRLSSVVVAPRTLDQQSLGDMVFLVHGEDAMWQTEFPLVAAWSALTSQQKAMAAGPRGLDIPLTQCAERLRFDFQYNAVGYGQWSMLVGSMEGEDEEAEVTVDEKIEDFMLFDVGPDTLQNLVVNVRARPEPIVQMYFYEDESYAVTAQDLAEFTFGADDGDEMVKQALQGASFIVHEGLGIKLRYKTPTGTMLYETTAVVALGGGRRLKLEQLPPSFLAEYRSALQKLRDGGG